MCHPSTPAQDFLSEVRQRSYGTILADPPWQFSNRTGKMAPEHLSKHRSVNIRASRMNCMLLSKPVVLAPFWSSSHVVSELTGINGATKWWTTHRHGQRIATIASTGKGSEHEDGYLDH